MTQALALRHRLVQAGHRVGGVLLGQSSRRPAPSFFLDRIQAPTSHFASPNFALDAQAQGIRLLPTLLQTMQQLGDFRTSLQTIHKHVEQLKPDLIINFFEPLAGVYNLLYRPATPMVCIAHQYLFLHPAYRFPKGHATQRHLLRQFTALTAIGARRKLALSLYPVPDLPERHLTVLPPLLRPALFEQPHGHTEPFFLVYMLNSGYAESIIRWHQDHPEVVLHCFWDKKEAPPVHEVAPNLTFHRLDDEQFLAMMTRCRGLVTTAGFESVAEAMYLGKPVLMVPVAGHFEQFCNALDGAAVGAGIASQQFDIERLIHFLPAYESAAPAFQGVAGRRRNTPARRDRSRCCSPARCACTAEAQVTADDTLKMVCYGRRAFVKRSTCNIPAFNDLWLPCKPFCPTNLAVAMQFSSSVEDFLSGAEFDSGLRVPVATPEKRVVYRMNHLEALATGKQVLHVGCVDHLPLIEEKIRRGAWLHSRLDQRAARCLGIDIHREGLAYMKDKLGYEDVVYCDFIQDPVAPEIKAQHWDLMILGELIEHIDNPVQFLSAIREKYAPHVDHLVITTPNAFRIENFLNAFRQNEHINSDHRYWFTPYTLGKVVVQAGMQVDGFQYCQGHPIPGVYFPKDWLLRRRPAYRDTLVMTAKL